MGFAPLPATAGTCATLACVWEATAPKPGNVYRGADFEDLTYVDFLTSAAIIGPVLEHAAQQGVGAAILEAVRQTHAAVATNTNLGMILLLAPLAAVPKKKSLATGIVTVLATLTSDDAQHVFEAIRTAQPGGLGQVETADVNDTSGPDISLQEAMQLAADRDLIARQYTNQFEQVFYIADCIEKSVRRDGPLSDAIVYAYLQILAEFPDSLIRRKEGEQVAREVAAQAAAVLSRGNPGETAYEASLAEFDFSLRTHRHNPGTSADLVAAALFVLLREERLNWPIQFYHTQKNTP